MSGDSPGRGHPGRGSSPSKAQAPRPNLGSNTQAHCSVDVNPKVLPSGRSVSCTEKEKKEEATDKSLVRESSNVSKETVCKTKMVESENPSSVHEGSPSQASGGSSTSTPGRQRRISLERQTIQENLQQRVMITSERTRSGSGHAVKETSSDPTAAKPSGAPTCTASQHTSSSRDPQSKQQRPPKQAAELHRAEQIPGLVRRMEALRKHKLHLQKQIDCTYKLKVANPGKRVLLDKKLDSLAKELADIVQEMDSVIEEMGPVGETYRNQERFQRDHNSPKTSRPEVLQSHVRPILQPATFPYERNLHKTETSQQQPSPAAATSEEPQVPAVSTMHNTNCALLPDGSSEGAVQAPQVPGGSALQDCGLSPEGNIVSAPQGGSEQDSQDCGAQGVNTVPEGNAIQRVNANDNVDMCDVADNPVCDAAPAEESSMVQSVAADNDGGEGTIQANAEGFPPLPAQHPAQAPSTVSHQPTQRPPQDSAKTSGNAWSRGSPHFSSNAHYTGQAFKRRNVVRFKHKGEKEHLPDRRVVVRDMLCHHMGFQPSSILAVINLPDRQGYDISFKLMSDLDGFWAQYSRVRDTEGWNRFSFIPISKPDTVNVTILFWNESVPSHDIRTWLHRHCDLQSDLVKTRDEDGIWTGGWKVLVRLRQHHNITHHLPNSFFIGREKGVCFYPGQPRLCFKCGKPGHIASVCSVVKCSLCGGIGHVSATCKTIQCNLCHGLGHPHRDCPLAWHNICRDLPDEDLMEGADVLDEEKEEEEALWSGSVYTVPETPLTSDTVPKTPHTSHTMPETPLTSNIVPETPHTSHTVPETPHTSHTVPETPHTSHTVPETPQAGNTEGNMEVVEQPVIHPVSISPPATSHISEGSKDNKKRKKDKSSRKPESEWTTVQKPTKVRVGRQGDVTVTTNRYSVLSESDGEEEIERELKRLMEEYDDDPEGDPPTKKKPLQEESQTVWEMETGSQQGDSDPDL